MLPVPIYEAARIGDFKKVKFGVERNASLVRKRDTNERLLIHWAAVSGNKKLVLYLLNHGSPVNPEDDLDYTPLILASSAGNFKTVKLLISRKATINHRNEYGHSALQYACSKGWREIAAYLLKKGADVNIVDERLSTPLHRCVSQGRTSIVRLLLQQRAIQLNPVDVCGNTPFHLACEEERENEIILLINAGAATEVVNNKDETGWDMTTNKIKRLINTVMLSKMRRTARLPRRKQRR